MQQFNKSNVWPLQQYMPLHMAVYIFIMAQQGVFDSLKLSDNILMMSHARVVVALVVAFVRR